MASPITLRLDPELRRRVDRIARQRRTTASNVIREAITTLVERERRAVTPYESIKDLIGSVRGGDPKRSTRRLSDILKARRRK
jgi:Arc/MetJ-type ribon-helix-helix transcriptional regulator